MARIASTSTVTVEEQEPQTISTINHDVLLTHILSRLDGPTLASASCVSPQVYSLSSHKQLWKNICHSTWPSTMHPRLSKFVSEEPRSFFSDCFPLLVPSKRLVSKRVSSPKPKEIISGVDIRYKDKLICSKVVEAETVTGWFKCSPFRLDLLEPKDVIPTKCQSYTCEELEKNLSVSWIVVDPMGHRGANFSTRKPVSVEQHWLSGEIRLSFGTILAGDKGTTEFVKCGVVVTCGRSEKGDVHVREVTMQVEDMEGVYLNGKDSLGILVRAMECGERKRGDGRKVHEEYLERKREKEERKLKSEGRMDGMCRAFGLSVLAAFAVFGLLSIFCYITTNEIQNRKRKNRSSRT